MSGSDSFSALAFQLTKRLQNQGLQPYDGTSFLHTFTFLSKSSPDKTNFLQITKDKTDLPSPKIDIDFRLLQGPEEAEILPAQIILVSEDVNISSIPTALIANKAILLVEPNKISKTKNKTFSSRRRISSKLSKKGAKLIIFSENISKNPHGHNSGIHTLGSFSTPTITVSKETISNIIKSSSIKIEETGSPIALELSISGYLKINYAHGVSENIICKLGVPLQDQKLPPLIIGAHLDHLGTGEVPGSRAKAPSGQIHNGADDNASGSAAVISLAEYFIEEYRRRPQAFNRDIYFALWSGEEIGLIGSSTYVSEVFTKHNASNRPFDAYINFDMIGRLESSLFIQGSGTSPSWEPILDKLSPDLNTKVVNQKSALLPTDTAAFYHSGIPVLSFFTGLHEDYHMPSDDFEKLNVDGVAMITDFARKIIEELLKTDSSLTFLKVNKERKHSVSTIRSYLGTVPDYGSTELRGLKIYGINENSPAQKAGLRGGDIIVALGNFQITNIYDLTEALSEIEPDKKTTVVVIRQDQRIELGVTPEAR